MRLPGRLRRGGRARVAAEDLDVGFPDDSGPVDCTTPTPDAVAAMVDALDPGAADENEPQAAKDARQAIAAGSYRRAEELLAGRWQTSGEGNLLGIAYAHLAHDLRDATHWQLAIDAFSSAAAKEPKAAAEAAAANAKAVMALVSIRPSRRP